jgi:hypothetical protein
MVDLAMFERCPVLLEKPLQSRVIDRDIPDQDPPERLVKDQIVLELLPGLAMLLERCRKLLLAAELARRPDDLGLEIGIRYRDAQHLGALTYERCVDQISERLATVLLYHTLIEGVLGNALAVHGGDNLCFRSMGICLC